ncbi:MAG: radical SAM protein [Anaerovoracaceae bacterium]|nr:B12-binding domain-containing radical SAM protein [Clostridiales bacterium]MDY2933665.1 radical SAM protein [Anaerovoracaceae bacterium]
MIKYVGDVYRPPSEAYSLIVQATIGCTHNKCSFCKMFKEKRFQTRPTEDIIADFAWARKRYRSVPRIFLADANALCLKTDKLMPILTYIEETFPECERVTIYGRASDVLRKTEDELRMLREHGLTMVYIGAESGSDKVLEMCRKGETRQQLIDAVKRIEKVGIKASVTFISGLAGKDGWEDHAIQTGTMITEMNASYVSLLTLLVDPQAPMYEDIQSGRLKLLTPQEVLAETHLMLENANPEKTCIFRSNHASNYLSLKGDLPQDRDRFLAQIEAAMKNTGMLKDERFRLL